jgi:hypothetical protein
MGLYNNNYDTTISQTANLVPGQWVTVTYDLSATPLDIAAVSQMGLQINTSAAAQCTGPLIGDGGIDAPAAVGARRRERRRRAC